MGVYERIKIEEENVHGGPEKDDREVLVAVGDDGGFSSSRLVSGANADTADADLEMAASQQIPNSAITGRDCSAAALDGRRREKSHHSQRLVSLDVFRGVSVAVYAFPLYDMREFLKWKSLCDVWYSKNQLFFIGFN